MTCRGIRGAVCAEANRADAILGATRRLLERIVALNELSTEDVASAIFTATPNLDAAYPARAARQLGWTQVPLLCMQEMPVPGGPPRCIRVLIHWNTDRKPLDIHHVYLGTARALRPDLAAKPSLQQSAEGDRVTKIIAFQGIAGAYSEQAIRQFYGTGVESDPYDSLEEIFLAVEEGRADQAMLPVENAVAGSVNRSYELLMEHDLRIHAEVILRVRHMLMAPDGTALGAVKRVRSHPQALAQCQRYLERHGLLAEPAFDTAGAARQLAAEPEPGVAAVASALAADLYNLSILEEDIQDYAFNYTRFFVLTTESPARAPRNKTSLIFTTPHQPGALYDCMGEFAKRRINLSKIESRPRLNRPWQYVFYLDFEGHCQDPPCEAALMGLLRRSSFVKLLGSYPAATTPTPDQGGTVA